jgi:hypothetical protein
MALRFQRMDVKKEGQNCEMQGKATVLFCKTKFNMVRTGPEKL